MKDHDDFYSPDDLKQQEQSPENSDTNLSNFDIVANFVVGCVVHFFGIVLSYGMGWILLAERVDDFISKVFILAATAFVSWLVCFVLVYALWYKISELWVNSPFFGFALQTGIGIGAVYAATRLLENYVELSATPIQVLIVGALSTAIFMATNEEERLELVERRVQNQNVDYEYFD